MAWNQVSNIKGPKGDAGVQGIQGTQGPAGTAADIATLTHAAVSKATPVDADELPLIDSAASWGLKRLTWANLKTALQSLFFHRGNILGTVSQVGGIPTGAILQRGSNANGDFIRYADGTQICMKVVNSRQSITVPDGALFLGPLAAYGDYPAAFISRPAVSLEIHDAPGVFLVSGTLAPSATQPGYWVAASTQTRAVVDYFVSVTAVGRWF